MLRNESSTTCDDEAFQDFANYLNTTAPADTNGILATIRYKIIADRDTLIAYAVLCGLPFLLCLTVLLLVFSSRLGEKNAEVKFFPILGCGGVGITLRTCTRTEVSSIFGNFRKTVTIC